MNNSKTITKGKTAPANKKTQNVANNQKNDIKPSSKSKMHK